MTDKETRPKQKPWPVRIAYACVSVAFSTSVILFFSNFNVFCWNGLELKYYPTGELMSESNYRDGRRDGLSRWWDKDGTIRSETYYSKGRLHGLSQNWSHGTLNFETTLDHGVRKTETYFWQHGESEAVFSGTFKHGKEWDGQFVRLVNGPTIVTYEAGERTDLIPFENFVPEAGNESTSKAE
ncbi:MAG: hypothetical protein JXA96_08165 [Sedimentisphaerales bacterium]|nr:hypothetical protein [Sedimentisphaerales bacterium]